MITANATRVIIESRSISTVRLEKRIRDSGAVTKFLCLLSRSGVSTGRVDEDVLYSLGVVGHFSIVLKIINII